MGWHNYEKTNVVRRILPQHISEGNIIRVIFNEAHVVDCVVCKLGKESYALIDINSCQTLNIYVLPMTGSAEKISDNLNKFWRIRAKEEFTRLDDDKANASSPRNISYEVFNGEKYCFNIKEYSNSEDYDDF